MKYDFGLGDEVDAVIEQWKRSEKKNIWKLIKTKLLKGNARKKAFIKGIELN